MKNYVVLVLGFSTLIIVSGCGSEFTAKLNASGSQTSASTSALTVMMETSKSESQALTLVPSVLFGATLTLGGSGGTPPYQFSLSGCDSTIDSTTGVFMAANDVSTCQITLTDASNATAFASVNVVATVTAPVGVITPALTLVPGEMIQITPAGGTTPYSFSVAGCDSTINVTTGVFTAALNAPETCTVTVTDAVNASASEVIDVIAASAPSATPTPTPMPTPMPTPTPIPARLEVSKRFVRVLVNSTIQLNVSGGIPPYTYAVAGCDSSISTTGLFQAAGDSALCLVDITDTAGSEVQVLVDVSKQEPIGWGGLKFRW